MPKNGASERRRSARRPARSASSSAARCARCCVTARRHRRRAAPPRLHPAPPPPPQAYTADPHSGLQSDPPGPTTGKTVTLRIDPPEPILSVRPPATQFQPPPPRQGKRGRMLGFILLGVGLLVLANIFNIDQYVFPLLLIGAGVMLLRKR